MRLTVLGCWSAAVPAPGGRGSGYLVTHGDTRLLLDCGNGVLGELARHADLADIDAVVLTHLHNDHVADLYPLALHHRFTKKRVRLLGPEGTRTLLYRWFSLFASDPDPYVEVFDIKEYEPWSHHDVGGVDVQLLPVEHNVPAHAIRLEVNGRVFVYSGDSKAGALLQEAAQGADVLLTESTYAGEVDEGRLDVHMTAAQAGALAKRAGVKEVVLTHFLVTTDRDAAAKEAADAFGGEVHVAEEGRTFHVGPEEE